MNSITKISVVVGVLAAIAFVFGVFALFSPQAEKISGVFAPVTALAWGSGDTSSGSPGGGSGGDGCGGCGGSSDTYTPTHTPTESEPDPEPAVCNYLKASPDKVPYGGGYVTLKWDTSRASSVKIDNGIGSVPKDGSLTVFVDQETTFTLTAKNSDGSDDCRDKVTVEEPEEKPPVCHYLNVNPSKVPYGGGNVKLTWDTSFADNVSINNGIGSVSADGSKTVFVDSDTTFVLTASNDDGTVKCTDTVVVDEPEEEEFSCDYFYATPSRVDEGEKFTLKWGTTNADSVRINQGIGSVSDDGSLTLTAYHDETYTLTVTNGDDQVECSTSIEVDEDEEVERPRCDLEISDDEIEEGDKVRLSWDNENAEDILLEDDHDNVLIDTRDGDDYDPENDDITVKPRRDTEYTLTVYGDDGSKRTCEVEVEVDEEDEKDVTISTFRAQQPVIALAAVPYTGFEAGPVLTATFYGLLALWGVAVAYILVVKKGSIFGFALAGAAGAKAATVTPTQVAPEVAEPVVASTAMIPTNLPTVEDTTEDVNGAEDGGETSMLEQRAQELRVLLSTDALNFIRAQAGTLQAQLTFLELALDKAKEKFPTEDGWIVLNKERMLQLFR